MNNLIVVGLMLAAFGQLCVAILNFSLIRIMHWQNDLARVSLLVREVFHIHVLFISITLLIFSSITFRFAHEMAEAREPIYRWIACAIGLFWAIRAVMQVTHYSSIHWRGIVSRTVVHIILLTVYSGFAAVYFAAAFMK